MVVYPEIESWNEFYPSEIFILAGNNEDTFPVVKNAKIGTTIYIGAINGAAFSNKTMIMKKIGEIEEHSDLSLSLILVGYVSTVDNGG